MVTKLGPLDEKSLGKEAEVQDIELHEKPKCKHEFRYTSALEIRCDKCNMGLYIDYRDRLVNGHLFRGDKLII